jgi:hypothetical protein
MSEMDACFQQFFYADSADIAHNFPLVKTPIFLSKHPAEHGIMFDVVMAALHSHEHKIEGRSPSPPEIAHDKGRAA